MSHRFSTLALLLSFLCAAVAHAETAPPVAGPWKLGTTLGLNLSQSTFSNNWQGGDKGSIVWVANTDATAERQLKTSFSWSNHLQLSYGQTSQQVADPASGDRSWGTPDKTTDQIAFESIGRWTLQKAVDPYLSLRLDSQFSDNTSPLGVISFNPIRLKEAAGVARVLQKTEDREAIARLGFGFRQTFAKTFSNPPTQDKESITSNDGGIEWLTTVTRPVLEKKVLYKGELLVFQPVFYSKSGELKKTVTAGGRADAADYWKTTNIDFQNTFSAAITKHLSVNLMAQWTYRKFDTRANAADFADVVHNIRKAGQYREALSIGFNYRLL